MIQANSPGSFNELLAIISITGFAIQRSLEILDPIFSCLVIKITELRTAEQQKGALWGWTDKELKLWLMTVAAFVFGLLISSMIPQGLPTIGNMSWGAWDNIIIALAMSAGANGLNSVLKYGEYVKESRKVEVQPLPIVTITPTTVSVKPDSKSTFLAKVIGNSNTNVVWRVLETGGGEINEAGEYTAPANPGTYHIAAISAANNAAFTSATVLVRGT